MILRFQDLSCDSVWEKQLKRTKFFGFFWNFVSKSSQNKLAFEIIYCQINWIIMKKSIFFLQIGPKRHRLHIVSLAANSTITNYIIRIIQFKPLQDHVNNLFVFLRQFHVLLRTTKFLTPGKRNKRRTNRKTWHKVFRFLVKIVIFEFNLTVFLFLLLLRFNFFWFHLLFFSNRTIDSLDCWWLNLRYNFLFCFSN